MSAKILALAAIVGVISLMIANFEPQNSTFAEFESFKAKHSKSYASKMEEQYRQSIFMMNYADVQAHNADNTQTYKKGINQFSDLTQSEFVATYLTAKVNKKFTNEQHQRTHIPIVGDVDWTVQGKVSGVKNQGSCGSCWAFSTTGAIESALLLAGRSASLSEQQLVDCSGGYGNHGCGGGWMDSAFQYVIDNGITTQDRYPYKAVNQNCAFNGGDIRISSFTDVGGCDNLINALNARPVSVAVDASNWSSYSSGVLSSCGSLINHGVLAVGYNGQYWKIKNSWSNGWGESGFIRISAGNTCQVCSYPSYPSL